MALYRSRSSRSRSIALPLSVSLNVLLIAVLLWPGGESSEVAQVAAKAESVEVTEAEKIDGEVEATEAAEAAAPIDDAQDDDHQVTVATIRGSIPQTMAEAAAPFGDNVSATMSRLLVWHLDLRRDLRAGDKVETTWVPGTSDGVVIKALRFHSQKLNRTIEAYRFQAAGDAYPSYWAPDGTEVPHRLRNSPLDEYEQVTSLLRDRPNHHGMDFKVDVGTPITTPFDGVVTRINWNTAGNGNCVEIRHQDGVLAKHLHLSETKVRPGDRVRAGQVIALSGNTGRSTGPHLHYQLNQGSRVIDPIDYHGTDQRTLPESDRAAFEQVVAAAQARLDAHSEP